MKYIMDKTTWTIVLLYALWFNCFNFYIFADWAMTLGEIKEVILLFSTIVLFSSILKSTRSNQLDKNVSQLIFMSIFSILVAFAFWSQSFYSSLRAVCGTMFPLIVFFMMKRYQVPLESIKRAIVVICIIHGVLQVMGTITFPDHLFGFISDEAIERSLSDLENRGVLRLAIPGSDFVPMTIFIVMVLGNKSKTWYLLLIPLFVILLMRGTRTPFFFTSLICLLYYIMSIKRKFFAFIVGIFAYFLMNSLYENLLVSTDNNVIVNYVQMTHDQLESNNSGDEDVRVRMSKYYLFDFNKDNMLKNIFGNGIPGRGAYAEKTHYMSANFGYWVVDVGFVEIFVYFGIIGLLVYFSLLKKAVMNKCSDDGMFAKLAIIYYYLILPTNSMLISNPIPVAIALYSLYISQKKYVPKV